MISILGERSKLTLINSQKVLTEPNDPHYTTTCKLQIQILILNSIEVFGSLKHVITITLLIRYMGCYSTYSMLQFRLAGGGDRTKHCWKMKRRQRARFGSMERKRDTTRRCDDVGQRRGGTGEGKGRRRCLLGWCKFYWAEK
jgi:hypothetical protein